MLSFNAFIPFSHLSYAYTEFEDVIDVHGGMPLQASIYLNLLWDFYLQWKPASNLSDLLKMWVSPPWNLLSLLLPFSAPRLPGLVLAQIHILKCASHLNSGSVDPFIGHFKPRAICASFHWNGCVPHQRIICLCVLLLYDSRLWFLWLRFPPLPYTHFWKCLMSFADKIRFSSILRRNQIMHSLVLHVSEFKSI